MCVLQSLKKFAVLLSFCLVSVVQAQELRIETNVYSGDATEPLSHTVTLFDSGTVYDFVDGDSVDKPAQIAVFRPPTSTRAGQFILLDPKTKQRTEVSTEQIDGLMQKLTKWAEQQDDPLIQFSAKPTFDEQFDLAEGRLTLSSEQWTYTVATVPAQDMKTLGSYRLFTDWYTRLNVMMHGTPPAGPRLALNAALEKHGVVPVEIRRKVDSQTTPLRATHLFSWRLSREDRARVEEVRNQLANFKKVENADFLAHQAGKDVVRGQSK